MISFGFSYLGFCTVAEESNSAVVSLLVLIAREPHLNFWIFQWCWWPPTWSFLIALARGMLLAVSRHAVSWWILWSYIIVLLISIFTVCHRNLGIHLMWKASPSVYLSQLKNPFPWYWIERQWVSLLVKNSPLNNFIFFIPSRSTGTNCLGKVSRRMRFLWKLFTEGETILWRNL